MELQNVVVSLKEGGHVQVSVHAVPFIILCNDFDRKAALVHIIGSVLPILINKERINVVMNPVANTVITIYIEKLICSRYTIKNNRSCIDFICIYDIHVLQIS